jgi:phosphate transport system substrate-binding protein
VVHKDNPLEQISFQQIDAIFSSTRHRGGPALSTWGQLGITADDWANQPVHAYGIKPWNGFEEFVRQRVLSSGGKRGEWGSQVHLDPVVFPIAARVAEDRNAIGYTGLAYVDAGVRVLALAPEQGGPAYAPSYESVARADYPLSRLIYFNTNAAPDRPLDPAIAELLRFILSREGQQIVLQHRIFLPLRESQAAASRALLAREPAAKPPTQ